MRNFALILREGRRNQQMVARLPLDKAGAQLACSCLRGSRQSCQTVFVVYRIIKDDAIKGPMLQYELRIYRHWKCPTCSRTVRTRGAVASRLCECSQPANFMQLIDTPAVGAFDASAFTTYDNEVDSTPTERELVEELPAHLMPPPIDTENIKPTFRRGTGYLRAESAPEVETIEITSEQPIHDSFGAGIDSEQADAVSTGTPTAEQTEGDDANGPGRKRRRRRRRKPRDEGDAPAMTTADPGDAVENSGPRVAQEAAQSASADLGTSKAAPEAEDSETSGEADGTDASDDAAPKKKRRRKGK